MVSIPRHSDWTKFKVKYGIGSGAVGGVNIGKSLDKYHDGLGTSFSKNAELAKELAPILAKYLKGIPESKVAKGKYSAFKSEFTVAYLGQAEAAIEEFKTMGGDKDAFAGRVGLLVRAAGKLKAGSTLTDLQSFRSGPVRGMMAAATHVKGYDPATIVGYWRPVDEVINKLGGDSSQELLDKVTASLPGIVEHTKSTASQTGLSL